MIRVFIIAASPGSRAALASLLVPAQASRRNMRSRESNTPASIELAGNGSDLDSLEGGELNGGIDVLLIDASESQSASLLADIRDSDLASDLPIALVSDHPSPEWSAQALRDGIRAILPTDVAADQLVAALQAAAAGLVVLHPTDVSGAIPAASTTTSSTTQPLPELAEALTRREREVLQMLAAGLGNKEIAARLNISDHTAKFHVAAILAKLGASTRTEAVTQALRRGLILL